MTRARKTVPRTCLMCGESFLAEPYEVNIGHAQYCSNKCRIEAVRSLRPIKTCLICGNEFSLPPVRINTAKYCSRACASVAASARMSGPNHHNWKRYQKECECCGKQFWTRPSRGANPFCSQDCRAKTMRGQRHGSWKGGVTEPTRAIRASDANKKWRQAVFERDNFTCQNCGVVRSGINAHHIFSFTGFPEHRFDVWNGITLCTTCHKLEHRKCQIPGR